MLQIDISLEQIAIALRYAAADAVSPAVAAELLAAAARIERVTAR